MNEKVLFVDDDHHILQGLKRNLRKQFQVFTALGGEGGIKLLKEEGPFEVVVSDMRMPGMNGTQFLNKVREIAPDTIRMLLTGQADFKDAVEVVNKGQIFRFLTKPCPTQELSQVIQDGIQQYHLIKAEKELLEKTLKGTIKLLVDILSNVNPEAFSRSIRVHKLCKKIAKQMKWKDTWQLDVAALLSQIGCVTIPGELLKKKYSGKPLAHDEAQLVENHMEIGRQMLIKIPRMEKVANAIAYQEKRFDGGGKPQDGKKGEAIPVMARFLKVTLDYDTMLSSGKTEKEAQKWLHDHYYWYDPKVLAALDAEIHHALSDYVEKEIRARELLDGMILADDIKTKYGAILIPKGHEISSYLLTRVQNFANSGNIAEPIKILERKPAEEVVNL